MAFENYQDMRAGDMTDVISPNGGESVPQGRDWTIRWRAAGFEGTVDIEYSPTVVATPPRTMGLLHSLTLIR